MIQFFINRAGKSLSPTRRRELEKAKRLLQDRQRKAVGRGHGRNAASIGEAHETGEANMGSQIEKSIEVNVPVRTAYNQWAQFEEFPRFMEGVVEVR
jgi:uncharacterized membrane protein